MPLPEPRQDESESDFISRCMLSSIVEEESSSHEQAVAICTSQWRNRERESMSINDKLLQAIRNRTKQESFGCGILTADRWVANLRDQIGIEGCNKYCIDRRKGSFEDLLSKAAKTLTYSNNDMRFGSKITTADGSVEGVELPKNTLMAFRHTLTSSAKDRDGDVLRSEGMTIDPHMLLLWQHVHTLPIGKSIKIHEQNTDRVEMISAIVDMNELSHDAAVMIDNGMGRFSHGFRAIEFEEMKNANGDFDGFDVKRAEIMEESLVSVPANVDAETHEVLLSLVENGKLTSPLMKQYGTILREDKPPMVSGISFKQTKGDHTLAVDCSSTDELKTILGMGKNKGEKDEDTKESKGAGDDSSPEETCDVGEKGKETKDLELSEVKRYGELSGSWESKISTLGMQAKQHLKSAGLDMGDRDWAYLVATYDEYAIICAERAEYNVPDEFRYFKVEWELKEGEAKLKGGYAQVDIVTNVELRERAASLSKKKEVDEAAIVILSRSTEAQKRALISQLTAMLPSKKVNDYKKLVG